MKRYFQTLAAIGFSLAAVAVTSQDVTTKDFSGWLDEYESLVFDEEVNAFVFTNEEKRGSYEKIMLQSVSIYGRGAKASGDLATQATDYMTAGAMELLESRGILATEPGPKTLRYSMAITAVEKSTEGLKAHNLIPVSALFRGAKAASGNLDTYIDAMFEGELVDSVTGERVMATVRRGIGQTDKKSGDEFEFEDVKPTLDLWLEAYAQTLDGFLAKRK